MSAPMDRESLAKAVQELSDYQMDWLIRKLDEEGLLAPHKSQPPVILLPDLRDTQAPEGAA